ncbi:hypothetical protein [uncultured Paludibaculum sp.]|uniref:hypothetical protein n=1 Tax=uncultured Paludibaculum sp. TaxID=1765020 RepID=UPI002AAAE0B9|nr:hypothetical protein [uncultured Paludibaculum sp.]
MDSSAQATVPHCPHLVTQAALECRSLFRSDRDRFVYLALARQAARRFSWRLLGYSLLLERSQLIVSSAIPDNLDGGVRWMRRAFSSYLRTDRGDRRRLWQSGYGLHALEGPMVWRALACIEIEPVRRGLSSNAESYLWSSAAAHLGVSRPYVPLDYTDWQREFGIEVWRDYLDRCPGDIGYWRALQWASASDFTPAGRGPRVCEIVGSQSEPAELQACLGFDG